MDDNNTPSTDEVGQVWAEYTNDDAGFDRWLDRVRAEAVRDHIRLCLAVRRWGSDA